MAGHRPNAGVDCQIYQTLDPTKRQIRVLELHPGTGNALVDAVLIVTSIPSQTPIVHPNWEMEDLLSQRMAEKNRLLALVELKEWLKIEKDSLDTEFESLKSQIQQMREKTPSALEVEEEVKLRIEGLRSKIKRYQRLVNHSTRMAKQIGVSQQVDSLAAESKELLVGKSGPLDLTKDIGTSRSDDEAQSSRMDRAETLEEHATMISYEAVSYCWNNSLPKSEMLLNGVSFNAPSSAIEVLRNLRLADNPRVLWIDAVCINQADLMERGQQVELMGHIYTGSTRTLIWLGPSADDTKTQSAFQLCSAVAQHITGGRELHELSDIDTVASTCQSVSVPDEYSLALLDIIYARRWFTRLWVWQEAALPPYCICHIGRFTVPWQDIMLTAFWWIEVTKKYIDSPPESLPNDVAESNMHFPSTIFMTGFCSGPKKPSYGAKLSQIVQQSRHCDATDPRDKIYGLLGMTRWSKSGRPLPAGIEPKYYESVSVRNCMRDATRAMIEEDRNLNVLSDELLHVKEGASSQYEAWPSWTPVWCVKDDFETAQSLDVTYCADNDRALSIDRLKEVIDPDTLILDGYEIDSVERSLLVPDNYFVDIESAPADFRSLHREITYRTPMLPQKLLQTLLADRYEGSELTEDDQIITGFVDHLLGRSAPSAPSQFTQSNDAPRHITAGSLSLEALESVRRELRKTSIDRQLFMTKSGRAGIGPSSTRELDTVVVLFGGQWPFILREQECQHVLVGHCYVQGIMDGEAVRDLEAREIPVKTFEIR